MSTPSCRRMPPRRGDLRSFAAITGLNAANPGKSAPIHVTICSVSGHVFRRAVRSLTGNGASETVSQPVPPLRGSIIFPLDRGLTPAANTNVAASRLGRVLFARFIPPQNCICGRDTVSSAPRQTRAEAHALGCRRVGTTKDRALIQSKASPLTPYSAIFCRPVFANQRLARLYRKIFKTGSLKVNHFNILQIYVCNLLKPEILNFFFFLR